jgi:hypothetical protein
MKCTTCPDSRADARIRTADPFITSEGSPTVNDLQVGHFRGRRKGLGSELGSTFAKHPLPQTPCLAAGRHSLPMAGWGHACGGLALTSRLAAVRAPPHLREPPDCRGPQPLAGGEPQGAVQPADGHHDLWLAVRRGRLAEPRPSHPRSRQSDARPPRPRPSSSIVGVSRPPRGRRARRRRTGGCAGRGSRAPSPGRS